jgi:DNA-directed RNA polymerase subunit RPC12/RpoP
MDEVLAFYSRKDIQKEMLRVAKNREIAVKYGDKGFGKRPDILQFPGDIVDLARSGVTSFHISEERWSDPLQLKTGMTKKQLDDLRTGWDLIIDLDCKNLEYSKIAAHLVIEALKFHDVKNLSVKFSGNKGLHIAVPFEAFPEKVENTPIKMLFPDGPKIIALYLGSLIKEKMGEEFIKHAGTLQNLAWEFEKDPASLEEFICPTHKVPLISKLKQDLGLVCPRCGGNEYVEFRGGIYVCAKCPNTFMTKTRGVALDMQYMECPICGKKQYEKRFNPFMVLSIDTVLISSRHMIRAPYSYNEKSGLISIPIKPEDILIFKKEQAEMKNVKVDADFLNLEKESDASQLLVESFDWWSKNQPKKSEKKEFREGSYEEIKEAIAEEHFPPCIKALKNGVSQDGRKRALFILINFLQSVGWNGDAIKKYAEGWNKKNYEALKEGYVISQLNYRLRAAQKILPPNCDNIAYYKDIGVCKPDDFCSRIKNPVNYAIRKGRKKEEKKRKS